MEIHSQSSIDRRKVVGLITAGIVGATYLLDYLDERRRQTSIWEYETRPQHTLNWDKLVRVASNPLMKLVADGIISHHWDWVKISDRQDYKGNWVESKQDRFYERFGDRKLTILHHALGHTIWGIRDAYALSLDLEELVQQGVEADGFHYGFQVEGMMHVHKNRILIPPSEKIKLLISTRPMRVLALDSDNNELPAKVEGPISRRDPGFKGLRQF